MWRWLSTIIWILLAAGIAAAALGLGWWAALAVRGRNVSDVGVAMYERGALALGLGLALPIVVTCGALWLLGRACPARAGLLWRIGLPALTLCAVPYGIALLWTFG